jgi:hypothetical protein
MLKVMNGIDIYGGSNPPLTTVLWHCACPPLPSFPIGKWRGPASSMFAVNVQMINSAFFYFRKKNNKCLPDLWNPTLKANDTQKKNRVVLMAATTTV